MQVQSLYSYLPRSVVEKYIGLCATCSLRKPQATKPLLWPILANGFFSCVQVSSQRQWSASWKLREKITIILCRSILLIWDICHTMARDGFYMLLTTGPSSILLSLFHAKHVVQALQKHLFSDFGLPNILYSDNGRDACSFASYGCNRCVAS